MSRQLPGRCALNHDDLTWQLMSDDEIRERGHAGAAGRPGSARFRLLQPVNEQTLAVCLGPGRRPTSLIMPEELPARATDALAEWIVEETEAAISVALDELGPAELQFLAGAMIAKGEERPKNDRQLGQYLRASKRLLDRAIAAGLGR